MASYLDGFVDSTMSESEDGSNGSSRSTSSSHCSVSPPIIGNMVRVASSTHIIPPDSEENVEAQTEDIFVNYVYQRYRLDVARGDVTPPPPDLLNFYNGNNMPYTPAAEIGRQLASMGDDITKRYSVELDEMISSVIHEDAYDAFAHIARRVFRTGIRWHRILVLLNFGYRLAMVKLRHSAREFSSFMSRIVSFIVKFIVTERIARWIAQQGGWRAALNFSPGTSTQAFLLVSAMAALSIIAVIVSRRFL